MQWSKQNKLAESLICPSLKERLRFHSTNYNKTYDNVGRCWITVDKVEIFNACTMTWVKTYYGLANEIREANNCLDYTDPSQKKGYYGAYDSADAIVREKGIHSQGEFEAALKEWTSLSIEDSFASDNPLIRAFAMVDRRLGKRRLQQIVLTDSEHPLVRALYQLRCDAEGLS